MDGTNTVWSDEIQGVQTLYLSRKLRFDDRFFPRYAPLFRLDREKELRILEVGCGPGALAGALHRWYPRAHIFAVDRDSRFIAFAREQEPEIEFKEGDATSLPYEDGVFDVTISHTVHEHVEPNAFWGEQRRVLRPGGVCLCLSVRKSLRCKAPGLAPTAEEDAFWAGVEDDAFDRYQVGRYATDEARLPADMERYGFTEVSAGYIPIDLTPDDPKYPRDFAAQIIESERQADLEAIRSVRSPLAGPAINAVNAKYDERIRLLAEGVHQWDTETILTMAVRGVKRPA